MKKKQNPLRKIEEETVRRVTNQRDTYANKYPWLFAIAGAFGIVSIFYGFEKLIDQVDVFVENPWILLATGLAVLAVTGSFYNKLR
jgi:uncharacterized integral membrane protein